MNTPTADPLRFCFGLHLHQPVGNFGYVFEQHVRQVYRPFLERAVVHQFFPLALHISGPLLEWLEEHDRALLELLGRHAATGEIEFLLAGFYEPILAAIPKADRLEQIAWMREALQRLFGVQARGLWLTERVWEPDLAADLREAGVEFVLVDDRHFLVAGFGREELHAPYRTEHDGKSLALFPIDERLRYLVPFQPVARTLAYLAELRGQGAALAVLADDGEKFGGWPGTAEWVYGGWLDSFMLEMRSAMERGELRLSRFDEALSAVPSGGLAYLGTASYREMEGWSLPLDGALRLAKLEEEWGEERLRGPEGALLRGSHWRNFLVKYPEANRMHKKMQALSRLCRERGDPPGARRAIARAQCNDAYWHGVFGGLYLPFLRAAVWSNLARAERELRSGEGLVCEALDLDCDGLEELWIHSARCSVVLSPARGGSIEEATFLDSGFNLADVLTRRREAYHVLAARSSATTQGPEGVGTPSIHELEQRLTLVQLPPVDKSVRAILQERVLPADATAQSYAAGTYEVSWDGTRTPYTARVSTGAAAVTIVLTPLVAGAPIVEKRVTIAVDGGISATYTWDPAALPDGAWFATELSCARQPALQCHPAADCWSFDLETVSKSERGLDRSVQGVALLVRWPGHLGSGWLALSAP
jgi:hypothetical protein